MFTEEDQQQEIDFAEDFFAEKCLKPDLEYPEEPQVPELEEDQIESLQKSEEGTELQATTEIFPEINPEKETYQDSFDLKRSESALNIFDQTTILKLFSASNWTETFFNRIFRKKFLVISGDEKMLALKNGFDIEQLLHASPNYPRNFLPTITSTDSDKTLSNGLLLYLTESCMFGLDRIL